MRCVSLLVLGFAWLLSPLAVWAQSPVPHDHCTCSVTMDVVNAFNGAQAVFVGRVVSLASPTEKPLLVDWLDRLPGVEVPGYAYWRADMEVIDSWKGLTTPRVTVQTQFGVSCGVDFKVGDRYVVYANNDSTGWETTTCTGTVNLASAGPDLKYLNARPKLPLSWPVEWPWVALAVSVLMLVVIWGGWRWLRRYRVSFQH